MFRNLFPFEITKRIYFFTIIIIIIPVIMITLVTQLQFYRDEMGERKNTLYSVVRVLDLKLEQDFSTILKERNATNKTKDEQIRILNQVLQPEINHMLSAFPDIGMGYYSKEFDSRIASGPNFTTGSLKPLRAGSPHLEVYKRGTPIFYKTNSSKMWNGQSTLSLSSPIYRNGKIIGHIFANTKLTDVYSHIFKEIIIVSLIALAVLLLTLTISWDFFRKLQVELGQFANAVICGDSTEMDRILPELNPVIELVRKHTKDQELVVKQLITEVEKREEIEGELIEANDKITNILEYVTDAFIALDKEWHFTYINSEAERQISVERGSLIGKPFQENFPNADLFIDHLATAMLEHQPVHINIWAESIDKWFEITAYPSKDGLGVYFRDITERKNAEDKIVFQANLLNQVRNVIITTDLEGKVTYVNSYVEILYGWKAEEIVGQDIDVITVKPETLVINGEVVTTNLREKGYWEGDIEILRKDGLTTPVHRIVTLIKNSEGTPTGIVSVGIDLTERKKLEKDIARLDQLHMVGEMAAGIGHEVRNPMTTVRGFIQLLAAKENNDLKRDQFKLMIEELDRANSIITEYLSLAKNKKVELKPQCLNSVIKNIFPLLQADAMVSDKYIQTELQSIPDLLLDEKEISQLVINLVRNGFESMKPGGTVTLRTYMDAGFVVLAVKDEGSGVDPEIVDRIGTPFVTTKASGTGLGLAVSYSIAGRHNAKIDMESTPEGTTFFIKFRNHAGVSTDVCYSNAV